MSWPLYLFFAKIVFTLPAFIFSVQGIIVPLHWFSSALFVIVSVLICKHRQEHMLGCISTGLTLFILFYFFLLFVSLQWLLWVYVKALLAISNCIIHAVVITILQCIVLFTYLCICALLQRCLTLDGHMPLPRTTLCFVLHLLLYGHPTCTTRLLSHFHMSIAKLALHSNQRCKNVPPSMSPPMHILCYEHWYCLSVFCSWSSTMLGTPPLVS